MDTTQIILVGTSLTLGTSLLMITMGTKHNQRLTLLMMALFIGSRMINIALMDIMIELT